MDDKKEQDSLLLKHTFLCFKHKAVLQQVMQNEPGVFLVFGNGAGKNQDIVKVREEALVNPNQTTLYLKCSCGVLDAVFHSSPSLIRIK